MNSIFHINVFSQIPLAPSSPIEGGENIAITPTEEGKSGTNRIRTAVATGLLALSLSAGAQESPTAVAMIDTQPILLAQAAVETDGNTYIAEVVQVDGTKKTVKYFRDAEGAIIPPPIVNGKLVDGSNAPDHPLRAKNAQVKILVKYDKSSQTMLAMVGTKDLIKEAFNDIKLISDLAEQGKLITKEQLQKRFLGLYILILSGEKVDEKMKLTDVIATTQLKINNIELNQMKRDAELKAIKIWRSTTGAVAIG